MKINAVVPIDIKPIKLKTEHTPTGTATNVQEETKPLSYLDCVNFKAAANQSLIRVGRRLSHEIGPEGAGEIVANYSKQIKRAALSVSALVFGILERKPFLMEFYRAIEHPIATLDHSFEMKMVPMHLELAKTSKGYRFAEDSVKRITESFNKYMTEGDKSEIVKELLSIGEKNNNPLSEEEIINFLSTTTGFTKKGQEKVLSFVRYAKEDLHIEPKAVNPFEYTKNELERLHPGETITEKDVLESSIYQTLRDSAVREYLGRQIPDITEHIKHENQELVNMIASSADPKYVAEMIQKTGITPRIQKTLLQLAKISNLIPEKPWFIKLLSEKFIDTEIFEIANALQKKSLEGTMPKIIKKIQPEKYERFKDINALRRRIIKDLDIADGVYLKEIEPAKPIKVLSGSYEGGKNR